MKLKRSIKMLMCCMAVAGTLAVNGLTVEAVTPCKHTFMQEIVGVAYDSYHDANYHYTVYGTHCVCPCGYECWKNLYEEKSFHSWEIVEDVVEGVKYTRCSVCHFKPEIVIVNL